MTSTTLPRSAAAPSARARTGDPRWVRPSLLGLLALTAVLYLWGLSASGWANDFYAAAVQAGSTSWKAFFYGSSDSSNFITVDKPPASLWVMDLSARIFGLSSWSLLVPQALEGVAAVGVLYAAVRRVTTPAAGLVAGAVLALTPVAALMFRFDNPDALLVLLLVGAGYAMVRAVENGRTRWLVLAGVLIGFGFLTKQLQAFLVVPGFALAYLIAGPPKLLRRLGQLALAGLALVVSAGWWVAIVELVPAADRPYIGGSTTNSVLQLTFGYNGFGRLTGNETGSVFGNGSFTPQVGRNFSGGTGLGRLFSADMGGQISWLLPAALLCLLAGLWLRRRAGRTDLIRASYLVWGSWLLVTGAVFSFASGIIHPYYTVALAPAIGALIGLTGPALWRGRSRVDLRVLLAAVLAVSAIWAYVLLRRTPDWQPWLRWVVLVGGLAAALVLLVGHRLRGRLALLVAATALVVGLAGPAAYAVQTAATAQNGAIPSAGPSGQGAGMGGGRPPGMAAGHRGGPPTGGTGQQRFGGQRFGGQNGQQGGPPGGGGRTFRAGGPGMGRGRTVNTALVAALKKDASSYPWVAATTSTSGAASYQLAAREPVMGIGGFNGTDNSITLAAFKQLVADHKIHYFLADGRGFGGMGGGRSGSTSAISSWVTSTFTAKTIGGQTVYDLTE